MRLTRWTDYALRVLMYCAANRARERAPTIAEIAEMHGISRSHLMKVVMHLAAQGWIETTRGRGGGLRMLRAPEDISVGEVVRRMESDFDLVECFAPATNQCQLAPACLLKSALAQATRAFLQELDGFTLSDLVSAPKGPLEQVMFERKAKPADPPRR